MKSTVEYIIKNLDTVTAEEINELKRKFNPSGSGPLAMLRIVNGLLNQIAELKHLDLNGK